MNTCYRALRVAVYPVVALERVDKAGRETRPIEELT